ncbi:DUF693 family protein [Borrelia crocidurae]|uniref:Uncharacterized protein n=2 Tax=Borrelia TaxID=138 RepID=I0FDW1_BORCA|nr:DUF693 family protein [Borrelia crocidurae]AFI31667.1 Protein of unknown function (DUF693)-containing protein [Borrelia crocidurae str. Achema]
MIKYDFKIEFYNSHILDNSTTGDSIPEDNPKIVIETHNGIHVDISISDLYSSYKYVASKQAKLTLWNLPLDFTESIKEGDIVKIFYKKFYDAKQYDFIMAGYLGVPMSTDYPSGDFSVDLELHLASKSNFFNRKLENTQFKGMTVEDAIKSAFPNRNIINMSIKDRSTIITESFYAETPKEFVEKITKKYVQNIKTDIGNNNGVECNYIFTNINLSEPDSKYIPLEYFGLEFIPQQEISIGTTRKIRMIYWRAKIMYTHTLKVGTKVSFIDSLGQKIKNTILETSAILSNTGECSLMLKLHDDSNHIKIEG